MTNGSIFAGLALTIALAAGGPLAWTVDGAPLERRHDRVYIVDRRGERWDVTQAESVGFRPEGFQYGIGRYTFTPLDDSSLRNGAEARWEDQRVIGITEGGEARAYSVGRLSRHEIANSRVGGRPVAAAY